MHKGFSAVGGLGFRPRSRGCRRYADSVHRRSTRALATLIVTGLCAAYIVWKIDLGRTLHILVHAEIGYFLGAVAIMVGSVWPMAWRWQRLLAAKGIHDRLAWPRRGGFLGPNRGPGRPA